MTNSKVKPFLNIFVCCFLLFTASTTSLEGGDLHAILVSNTTDQSIGDSVKIDLRRMEQQMTEIAKYSGLTLKKSYVSGNKVLIRNVQRTIKELKVQSDDVVFFYYSGHGYRTNSKKSRWPNLFFSIENKGIDLDEVIDLLGRKKARLTLIFSDVCNSKISDWNAPPLVMIKAFPNGNQEYIKQINYKKLFIESTGLIIATSSAAGQFSYCTENDGGAFSFWLLSNLQMDVSNQNGTSWDYILTKTQQKVHQMMYNEQTPDFNIQLK